MGIILWLKVSRGGRKKATHVSTTTLPRYKIVTSSNDQLNVYGEACSDFFSKCCAPLLRYDCSLKGRLEYVWTGCSDVLWWMVAEWKLCIRLLLSTRQKTGGGTSFWRRKASSYGSVNQRHNHTEYLRMKEGGSKILGKKFFSNSLLLNVCSIYFTFVMLICDQNDCFKLKHSLPHLLRKSPPCYVKKISCLGNCLFF